MVSARTQERSYSGSSVLMRVLMNPLVLRNEVEADPAGPARFRRFLAPDVLGQMQPE